MQKFKEIGWNGFLFAVPEDVYLTRQGGDAKQGTLTLESEKYMIEIKWEPIPEKPIKAVADLVIEQARKNIKKKMKRDLEVRERRSTTIHNHDAVYLHLKSIIEERYYIWYCQESDRVVVFRLVCESLDEKTREMIKRFFNSLRCHYKGKNIWSLMKTRFETPESFLLKDAEIKVGRARFILSDDKLSAFTIKTKMIIVEYFSLANLVFTDTYEDPEKWFEKNYLKDLKKVLKKRKIEFKTSEKKDLEGHTIIIRQAEKISGLSSRSTNLYSTAVWYCPEMNRMYAVTVASSIVKPFFLKRELNKKEHEKIFNEIIESFKCH